MLIWIGHAPPLRVDSNPNLITNYTVGGWLDQSSQPRPIWLPLMSSTFHVRRLQGSEDIVCVCVNFCVRMNVCIHVYVWIKSLFSNPSVNKNVFQLLCRWVRNWNKLTDWHWDASIKMKRNGLFWFENGAKFFWLRNDQN